MAWVFLVLLSRPLTEFGVRFGPFEKFSLVMMAMVLIAAVSRGSLVKGLLSGALGMMVTMPGVDPAMGGLRLTYGYTPLEAGLNLLPVLIGVFAVGQIIKDLVEIDRKPTVLYQVRLRDVFLRLRDLKQHVVNLVRSSLIGTWVGILPGIGANIASAMAWSLARNRSRKPEKFGKGSEEGIVAAESANSASVGGALIPLIAMGIPGSVIDAILLGAMAMHAVTPGALLFQNNPDVVVAIMGSAMIANVMMFLIMSFGAIWIARLCQVPRARLLPVILVFCIIGAFAFRNNMFDVWVMLGFGVIGFLLERCRMPLAPFVIGLVLAPIAESSLRSGLMISAGSFLPLVTRPISAVLMGIAVLLLVVQIVNEVRARRAPPRPEGG